MRILTVANTFNSRTTGVARVTHFLREALVGLGVEKDALFLQEGIRNPLLARAASKLSPLLALARIRFALSKGERYDVVEIHTEAAVGYVLLRKFLRRLPPCLVFSHGSDEMKWDLEKEEERLGRIRLKTLPKLLHHFWIVKPARYSICNADHVRAAGPSEKRYYEQLYGIAPETVSAIPNGVGEEFFIRREYRLPPSRLLFLGGWEWRKGVRYLAEACSKIMTRRTDVTLSIVGVGTAAPTIKEAFPEILRARVHVIAHVPEKQVPHIYADHDIFVFPSLFEATPLVITEAMASGMAIVTTRACGMRDLIEDNVSGFLVSPRDTDSLVGRLNVLLGDPILCQRLGQAAQESARALTWSRLAEQMLQVYQKMCLCHERENLRCRKP